VELKWFVVTYQCLEPGCRTPDKVREVRVGSAAEAYHATYRTCRRHHVALVAMRVSEGRRGVAASASIPS